jgi:hypothetical protein
MRRVLAIGLALLVVMIAARGVVAQETSVNDRLLEILKERQIISDKEYTDLVEQLQDEQTQTDQRLSELDRSIADYLAQGGDGMGANVTYKKGRGFGFASGDGLFSMSLGGVFQFEYSYVDIEDYRDTNNFDIDDNRIILQGHAFDPGLTYYFEYCADGLVQLLDAYVDYNVCDWTNLRAGQFKTPFGRQHLVHESDREFFGLGPVAAAFNPDRDLGLMFHDVTEAGDCPLGIVEYALGIWNGEGRNAGGNDNNEVAWAARLGVYPLGFIPYVEGDWDKSQDLKFGIAGAYGRHVTAPVNNGVKFDGYELDGVLTWMGLFLTGEYFYGHVDLPQAMEPNITNDGWYAQAGYMVPDSQIELVGRYGKVDIDNDMKGVDDFSEWAVGFNYYMDGHFWKIGTYIGRYASDSVMKGAEGSDFNFLRIIFQMEW